MTDIMKLTDSVEKLALIEDFFSKFNPLSFGSGEMSIIVSTVKQKIVLLKDLKLETLDQFFSEFGMDGLVAFSMLTEQFNNKPIPRLDYKLLNRFLDMVNKFEFE